MSQELIKNFSGQIIAVIDTDSQGVQTLKTYSGTILGTYKPKENITQNYSGTILSQGNTLGMLINDPSVKSKEVDQPKDTRKQEPKPAPKKALYSDNRPVSAAEGLLWLIPPLGAAFTAMKDLEHMGSKGAQKKEHKGPLISKPTILFLVAVVLFVLFVTIAIIISEHQP